MMELPIDTPDYRNSVDSYRNGVLLLLLCRPSDLSRINHINCEDSTKCATNRRDGSILWTYRIGDWSRSRLGCHSPYLWNWIVL